MVGVDADLSCPSGSKWYTCTTGLNFVGCCASDPCGSRGCVGKDLRPATFNASYTENFSDQYCYSGDFYACHETNPPFLGCCKSNPCQQAGCPTKDLVAAALSRNETAAAELLSTSTAASTSTVSSSSAVASSTSSSLGLSLSSSATSSSATTTSLAVAQEDQSLSKGAIAGISAGGVLALVAIVAVIVALCTRRDRRTPIMEKGPFKVVGSQATPAILSGEWGSSNSPPTGNAGLGVSTSQGPGPYSPKPPPPPLPPNHSYHRHTFSNSSQSATLLNSISPEISSLSPSPDPGSGIWHSKYNTIHEADTIHELDAPPVAPKHSRYNSQSKLLSHHRYGSQGSDFINVGYMSGAMANGGMPGPGMPGMVPYNNGASYAGRPEYKPYRPPGVI